MRVAFGTSTPTSMTVVAMSSWIFPAWKASIALSFFAPGMRPCTRPTRTPGSASVRRAAVSSAACARSSSDSSISGQTQYACRPARQAYWVCPLIAESDELRAQAAEDAAARLAEARPGGRVGLVHGRAPAAAPDQALLACQAGKIQLLIATTVIEVGVDVPNATLMVIDNAERLGLAQLHQLRGRVGRGTEASSCVLLYRAPLSGLARERLKVIRETSDGFEIARRDLELRGPGELLGTRQTGLAQLRVADLMRDADLLPGVQRTAELLLGAYPEHVAALTARWVGAGERYGRVG